MTVEHARSSPDDMLMQVTVRNRGPHAAPLHILPQLCARSSWSWRAGALRRFHSYSGDEFRVECPVGSGRMQTLAEAADEVSDRLVRLFLRQADGLLPALRGGPSLDGPGDAEPGLLFHEYFRGDTGRGLGASHQTGWTSLVALLNQDRRRDA